MALNNFKSIEEALSNYSSPDIEKVVLGAFISYESSEKIISLSEELFTDPKYRFLFKLLKRMAKEGKGIDIVLVNTELYDTYGNNAPISPLDIVDITSEFVTTANLNEHIAILTDRYERRTLITRLYKNLQSLTDPTIDVEEILKDIEDAKNLTELTSGAKYRKLLEIVTEEDRKERISKTQGELNTNYEFTLPNGKKERFTLPSGALTFVCAPTSHGKSTLLQNIALQVAENGTEGDTLYFTFEEEDDSVYMQFLNKYCKLELSNNYNRKKSSNNLRAIAHYYRSGEDRFITESVRSEFYRKKAIFTSSLINSGKLRIIYEDYDSNELITAIKATSKELKNRGRKIKAVFIDYIQLLSTNGCKLQRREELRDIAKGLRKLAIELQLPIVVCAQLNRETLSPLELTNENIAESADLEREANKILCLWNSAFKARKSKDSRNEIENLESRLNFKLGENGKIYAILTKNRGSVRGIEALLTFNGNSGEIVANYTPDSEEELPFIEDPEDNEPF